MTSLVDEFNQKNAERIALEKRVAAARTPRDAYKLGVEHARAEHAAEANRRAFHSGAHSVVSPRPAAKASALAATAAAARAGTTANAPASAPTAGNGDIALRARAWADAEEKRTGKRPSAAQAVAHISTL
jgi:hypothetical protein